MSERVDERQGIERIACLHRQYGGLVRRQCRKVLGDSAAAEDAEQEVFVKIMESYDMFRGQAKVVSWIYRITCNICIDELRRRSRRGDVALAPEMVDSLAAGDRAPAERIAVARQTMERLLQAKDSATLEILYHTVLDGMSQEEIARVMGLSRKTVWTRLSQLRQLLQDDLDESRP